METLKPEMLTVLQFLASGLFAAWLFHRLMGLPKPEPFQAVIQGLIFTIVIRFLVAIEKHLLLTIGQYVCTWGSWTSDSDAVAGILTGAALGCIAVYVSSDDRILFAKLRKHGFTGLRSFPTEWFGAFKDAGKKRQYVVLQLKSGRRLMGYPQEWPTSPNGGHIVITMPAWAPTIRGGAVHRLLSGTSVLIRADDVLWIEFLPNQRGESNGTHSDAIDSGSSAQGAHI